jgi:uncharacterized protein (TIGR02145 family)
MNLNSKWQNGDASIYIEDIHRGICPEHWHIPSNDEWLDIQGSRLVWMDNDEYGFAALLIGGSQNDHEFVTGKIADFWGKNKGGHDAYASHFQIMKNNYGLEGGLNYSAGNPSHYTKKDVPLSIRCIED